MLHITIPETELFNESTGMFDYTKSQKLQLEHSLISVAKFESKWKKPFLSDRPRTLEESIDYIRCMTLTQNADQDCYKYIPQSVMGEVNAYIDDDMTATTFSEMGGRSKSSTITAEIIYYWMVSFNIPFECQKWHLNRLMTLIRVCSIKQQDPKKRSTQSILQENKAMNEARRKQHNTNG